MIYYSSCCGEQMPESEHELELCKKCGNWCELISEDEDTIPPKAKEFKPGVNLNQSFESFKQVLDAS